MQHNHSEIEIAGGGALGNRSQAEKVTYERGIGGEIQTELSVAEEGEIKGRHKGIEDSWLSIAQSPWGV